MPDGVDSPGFCLYLLFEVQTENICPILDGTVFKKKLLSDIDLIMPHVWIQSFGNKEQSLCTNPESRLQQLLQPKGEAHSLASAEAAAAMLKETYGKQMSG